MNKTKLIITRHGKTEWNKQRKIQGHTDTKLHEEGIAETKKSAEKLRSFTIDRIYTSTLIRARQTARILATELNLSAPFHELDTLRERFFGQYEGWDFEKVDKKFFTNGIDFFKAEIDGIESREEFIKRTVNAIDTIINYHENETILVVTHGGNISALLSHHAPSLIPDKIPNNCFYVFDSKAGILKSLE